MRVKIKKMHEDAVIPSYGKPGDAGMDLVAVSRTVSNEYGYQEYDTGLAIEIPEGYVGLLYPRSSLSKTPMALANSVGVIDSGYRGSIKLRFHVNGAGIFKWLGVRKVVKILEQVTEEYQGETYDVGDKIGQLVIMPYPQIEFEEVEELSNTERGAGGFGSTGS